MSTHTPRRRIHSVLLFLPALLGQQPQPAGQDWPQLLGPERNLHYNGPWSEKSSFARVWAKLIGEGFSSPVVSQGRLLIFHRKNNEEILDSLEPATGKLQWSAHYPTGYRDD